MTWSYMWKTIDCVKGRVRTDKAIITLVEHKVNMEKLSVLSYNNNKVSEKSIKKINPFTIA